MPGAKYITVTYINVKCDTINILLIDILKEIQREISPMKNYIYFSVGTQCVIFPDVIFGTWPETLIRKFREYTMWRAVV